MFVAICSMCVQGYGVCESSCRVLRGHSGHLQIIGQLLCYLEVAASAFNVYLTWYYTQEQLP